MTDDISERAKSLHSEAIVIDAVCPLLYDRGKAELYRAGGVTVAAPTVGGPEGAARTFADIGRWHADVATDPGLVLIRTADDIVTTKRDGKLGILFHFQGTEPIEADLDLLSAYEAVGVRVVQLTYNVRNRVGDGCEEPSNSGLSRFGHKLVERMNALGMLVDCSHTGHRTTMDAMAASIAPVAFSHANAFAVHSSPRNIHDDQIKALAATGGVIGIAGFPAFVSARDHPSLDDFIDHIAYIGNLVGTDHVGLGIDYFLYQHGMGHEEAAARQYTAAMADGTWGSSYPPPPYRYPEGIEAPSSLLRLTARLLERGFTDNDTRKILGGNWLRIYRSVFG